MAQTTAYGQKLRDPRWQKMRLTILQRDDFTCRFCGDKETELHVHHEEYSGDPWEADESKMKTVCKVCHKVIEDFKKEFPGKKHGFTKIIKEGVDFLIDLYAFRPGGDNYVWCYTYDPDGDELFLKTLIPLNVLSNIIKQFLPKENG